MKKKIVIFVSGSGSNMENIATYFNNDSLVEVTHVFTNKKTCGAVEKANKLGIPVVCFSKNSLDNGIVTESLRVIAPDLIVLAGFLLKIPEQLVKAFPNQIINVHPALLPKFGGKGMYGKHVHEAVIKQKETQSGITIHYVNEHYDEGNIIAQFTTELNKNETIATLQDKIHTLEMENFPKTIAKLLL